MLVLKSIFLHKFILSLRLINEDFFLSSINQTMMPAIHSIIIQMGEHILYVFGGESPHGVAMNVIVE